MPARSTSTLPPLVPASPAASASPAPVGQWTGRPVQGWRPSEVLDVRIRHQRPDAWSSRLYGCQNLSVAPTTARLAHHVLTKLDGGVVLHRYDVHRCGAGRHVVAVHVG